MPAVLANESIGYVDSLFGVLSLLCACVGVSFFFFFFFFFVFAALVWVLVIVVAEKCYAAVVASWFAWWQSSCQRNVFCAVRLSGNGFASQNLVEMQWCIKK